GHRQAYRRPRRPDHPGEPAPGGVVVRVRARWVPRRSAGLLDVPRGGLAQGGPRREVAVLTEPELREPDGGWIARPPGQRRDGGRERAEHEDQRSSPAPGPRRSGAVPPHPRRAQAAAHAGGGGCRTADAPRAGEWDLSFREGGPRRGQAARG